MSKSQKKILFVLSNVSRIGPRDAVAGYEFSEVAHPYLVLREAGHVVDFASPEGGMLTEAGYNDEDVASRLFRNSGGYQVLNRSFPLSEINSKDYDAVYFPGGLGPMVDLAADRGVKALIADAFERGRVVGAVCHGPAALLGVTLQDGSSLLKGRRVTSFTTAEEEGHSKEDVPFLLDEAMRSEGAIHSQAAPFSAHVVADGRLITGQNPASALGVGIAIVNALAGHSQRQQRAA